MFLDTHRVRRAIVELCIRDGRALYATVELFVPGLGCARFGLAVEAAKQLELVAFLDGPPDPLAREPERMSAIIDSPS